ncbi:MAG: ATP-binding cassette domain-containing protein [Propionibacteriaceae bacterium]|jgi:ATPase subunit of ABC transporter with duplicated ATPase domains|nr:ATP-binding cassette domain-containing protein [Propionibacteriaceae bacterium]
MPQSPSSVVLSDLHFTWPDGSIVFDGLDAAFTPGRSSLIGDNGSGKSTLLRLIAGQLKPTAGRISVTGEVAYLPQNLTLNTDLSVAELLGVADRLAAWHTICAGEGTPADYETLDDDWDIEVQTATAVAQAGLPGLDLDRTVGTLSGGEVMLLAVSAMALRASLTSGAITLLDEPTNNLDQAGRKRVAELVTGWPGTLIIVSHDRDLLEVVDQTYELSQGALTSYGGGFAFYQQQRELAQQAVVQQVRSAQQDLRQLQRRQRESVQRQAKRSRTAQRRSVDAGLPKILRGARQRAAENTTGRIKTLFDDRLDQATAVLQAAESQLREEAAITIDLPDPQVPQGRQIAEIGGHLIRGPERVGLIGPNGAGKTTLIEDLLAGRSGRLLTEPVGYLPQRLDGLNEAASTLDNLKTVAPEVPPGVIRQRLAQLGLRGGDVFRPVRELSGGERFRAALARLLLADPPNQLLILDEPTNNLDLHSIEQLTMALRSYHGALLIASHDQRFLDDVGLDTVVELTLDPTARGRPNGN